MKSFLVALSVFLALPVLADEENQANIILPAPSANYYLLSTHITRNIQIEIEKRTADLESAKALIKRDVKLLDMYSRLRRSGSVSKEEHQRILLRKKVSEARVEQLTHLIAELQAAVVANSMETKSSSGQSLNFKEVYNAYRAQWDAQCTRAEYDVKAAEAAEDFAGFEYQVAHALYQTSAGSLETYYEKEAARSVAVAEGNRTRAFLKDCEKKIPDENAAREALKNVLKKPNEIK